jgi:vancomycin resistance protein YoaR
MFRNRKKLFVVAAALSVLLGFGAAAFLYSTNSDSISTVIAADMDEPQIVDPDKSITRNATDAPILAEETDDYTPPLVLGEYSTEFSDGAKARNTNITVAAKSIDGVVVNPGQVFSYNDTIGPTTKNNGYKKAQIFIRGKKAYGYGGGVCQVSSTLYNAVEDAGLKVIERHQHSRTVEYVPKGKDAATSYGVIDFKFQNTLSHPVTITSEVKDGTVCIKIVKEND